MANDCSLELWQTQFFSLLAHSGVRVGELLGLTWGNVHLGDDPHLSIVEQVYRGERKGPKWGSVGKVPLSPGMAAWLAELRPEDVRLPVFPSKTGTALTYANVYNRVLRPALVKAGIALKVGQVEARKRDGTVELRPVWDYRGVAFHAFRHACGSLLVAHGKQDVQVQGWLRHARLSTTHDVYLHSVDDGLGGAEILDEILPVWGHRGATGHPQTAADGTPADPDEPPSERAISEQPQTAADYGANS